jgi:hypothetical protein
MERKTGFEPATLTLAKNVMVSVHTVSELRLRAAQSTFSSAKHA